MLEPIDATRDGRKHLLNHVGELYLQTEDFERAEGSFLAAERDAPWNPVYQWNLALVLERTDRCSEARVRWSRFLELAVDEALKEQAVDHLKTSYDSQGGICFGRPEKRREGPGFAENFHRSIRHGDFVGLIGFHTGGGDRPKFCIKINLTPCCEANLSCARSSQD